MINLIKKLFPLKIKLFFREIILQTLGLSEDDIMSLGGNVMLNQGLEQTVTDGQQYHNHKIAALEQKMNEIDRFYFQVLIQKIEDDFSILHEEIQELRSEQTT